MKRCKKKEDMKERKSETFLVVVFMIFPSFFPYKHFEHDKNL
jgi:nitrate reductase NapE component